MSLGAGIESVGPSPRLARLGLVVDREAMKVRAMRSVQGRQRCPGALSDKAASCGACRTALLATSLAAACLLAWSPAGAAPAVDPLGTPECVHARAELEAALAAPDARHGTRLERARRQARDACLGREAATRQRSGAPEPAQAVAPTLPAAPRAVLPAAPLTAPPPPMTVPRAAMITTCDPGGCVDTQGRRLNRAGPLLVGPTGLCSAPAGAVSCP
jgi:hypothetical protein